MKVKSVILSVLWAAVVVGGTIWLAVERQARLRLGEENAALRQQLGQWPGLAAENQRLSNLVARARSSPSLPDDQLRELLRLRGGAGVLRQQAKELEALRKENRQARAALESGLKTRNAAATTDYWPRDSWFFAGYASPGAALQSFFWAGSKGDVKTLRGGITGDVQKEVEKDLEGKSDSEASTKAVTALARLKSVLVLNREAQGDDTVVLTAVFEEGNHTETNKALMKKIGNDWKFFGSPE